MSKLQEIFSWIQQIKVEQKTLKKMYKDALEGSSAFKANAEEMTRLREECKQIEAGVKEDFVKEMDRLESLKVELESAGQMLSDVALTNVAKGFKNEIVDDTDVKYEPLFKVSFRKTNNIEKE